MKALWLHVSCFALNQFRVVSSSCHCSFKQFPFVAHASSSVVSFLLHRSVPSVLLSFPREVDAEFVH